MNSTGIVKIYRSVIKKTEQTNIKTTPFCTENEASVGFFSFVEIFVNESPNVSVFSSDLCHCFFNFFNKNY